MSKSARNVKQWWHGVTVPGSNPELDYVFFLFFLFFPPFFGPFLDDRLKEKNPETLKECSLYSLSCLSVCVRATGHTFWPRNLIFGLSDPWDMRKKRIFLFFEIFIFTLFIGIFRLLPYITQIFYFFQATGHSFSPRNVIFGLREPCTIGNWRLLIFF